MRTRGFDRLAIALMCTAIGAAGSPVAIAQPAYSETIAHYSISGRSVSELLDSIARNGPKSDRQGTSTVGRALPKFSWKWELAEAPDKCRIASASVTLSVTIRMPQWKDRDLASALLRAEWDRYYADVLKHERGHAEISKAAARRIERAILALAPRPTCPQMRDAIRPAVEALVRAHDAEQAAFDVKEGSCNLRKSCLGKGAAAGR